MKTFIESSSNASIELLISQAVNKFNLECDRIRNDYAAGARDCANGIYDKYYRYNRNDDGQAYDAGWYEANKEFQNSNVTFI